MRKAFFAVATLTIVALTGAYFSVRAATNSETRHVYLQTVLWVSKEAGPPATVKKYGEVYGFSPSTITVMQGERVDLTIRDLQAGGDDTHTFTLPAFGINKDIPPLGVVHVSFVANKAGVFPFHCEFHKPWMSGELVVLPKK
ncbi:MAG TPA: cupredoxin domain-containing protein [Candidatus Acidoferrales bacterium]|nr:cupredoxin domain-containing protein [Candidatus Acidoferrales bacterium]